MKARGFATLALATLLGGCAVSHGMYEAGIDVDCRDVPPAGGSAAPDEGYGLTWVRARGERDRALAAAWCETVGEAVVVSTPARDRPAPSPDAPVSVVTWNMNSGGGDLVSFLESELGASCGSVPSSASPAPFVLLLQEVYRRSARLPEPASSTLIPRAKGPRTPAGEGDDVAEVAERCGLALAYVPSHRNGPDSGHRPGEDKGNAIVSNLPLSAPVAIELPFEAYRRVAVAAEVRAPGRAPFRAVSVHLDVASLPMRMLLTGNQTRARQAAGLVEALELLDERRPPVSGTVVGADMNTWTQQETAALVMLEAFPQSPEPDGHATRGLFPTDHIFFRTADGELTLSAPMIVESAHLSDHRARKVLLHG